MSYHLKIKVDPVVILPDISASDISASDTLLNEIYQQKIDEFNSKLNDTHRDSGFDLVVPNRTIATPDIGVEINHNVSCAVYKEVEGNMIPSAYYLYPRSSISNTPLRLRNSVGICSIYLMRVMIC